MKDINERLERIYSAIDVAEEHDLKKLKATVIHTDKHISIYQDFRGGLTNPELSNQIHTVIHNIASFAGHLRGWAKEHDKDKVRVDTTLNGCAELKIILDLWDKDKHGGSRRDGGYSKKDPQLVNIKRVMRLQTQAKKGSRVTMTLGAGGAPVITGDGTAKAVVTGDIVDINNQRIGDFSEIASKAIGAWEGLLVDFELLPSSS